jgi:phosphoribosylformylglycinamidine synthase
MYVIRENGVAVVEIPGEPLVDGCPTYTREGRESAQIAALRTWRPESLEVKPEETTDPASVLLKLLDSPTIASKRWIYEQYDSTVRTSTVVGPGSDAAVIRLRGTRRAIAATTDCNARYAYLNPRMGGRIAVAEAARNLVCSGALPRAVTDNLNFGNPLKVEVYHQLAEAVHGIGEACEALETPVTGGNVSLYNENPGGAIYPTPTIGMVGVIENVDHVTTNGFRNAGDEIVLLGSNTTELGGSEYLKVIHGLIAGDAPELDLAKEKRLQTALLAAIRKGWVVSAHDVSEGGLAVTLVESAIADPAAPAGVEVALQDALPANALLYGEGQSRVVVSVAPEHVEELLAHFSRDGVPATRIGHVREAAGRFRVTTRDVAIDTPVETLVRTYYGALPRRMDRTPADVATALESEVHAD